MMGRVLVTGGAGFIGSHTVDRLIELGYDVRVLDALTPPVHLQETGPIYENPRGLWPSYRNPNVEYLRGDVRDARAWRVALKDIEAIIHLAAYQDYLPNFSTFFDTNTVGTALLYETIVAQKLPVKKVVIASSQAVYGEGANWCGAHGLVYPYSRRQARLRAGQWDALCPLCGTSVLNLDTKEDYTNPHNAYAISKQTQEQIGLCLARHYDIPTTALRYSIVQGPRQSFHNAYSGILRRFTLQLLAGRTPAIYEDGQQMRDYVAVQDVVDANILALQDPRADFEVFNVGGDRQISVNDYYHLLATKLGVDPVNQPTGEYRFGDTRHIVSSVDKLKALGWEPKVSLEEIVDGYIDWVKSQPLVTCGTDQADEVMRSVGTVRMSV